MKVNALDHFNVIATDIDASARFYADVLGLERRNGPPPFSPAQVQWMHDAAGRAIVHINSMDCPRAYDRTVSPGPTGAIHHIALNCSGHDEMLARLADRNMTHVSNYLSAIGLRQIFIRDPDDIVIELNFFEG